ncbi:hypothetical protein TWF506_005749 [Arthrobotrys conoides]|uniref:DUF4246 domain-containing protein n=1 Tax=Arthrobotrys conoides TaxID=74498 RepID=A0AAN8NEQ7_9PEZI
MYPHPLDSDWDPSVITYPKHYHRAFIVSALNQPDWTTRAADKSTVTKWFREAQVRDNKYCAFRVPHHRTWNESDVQYAWQELSNCRKYVESLRAKGCKVEPDIRGIWKADGMVGEELRGKLVKAASFLEKTRKSAKPTSKKFRSSFYGSYPDYEHRNIIDLINPSPWPVIYGQTKDIAKFMPIQVPVEILKPENINCLWRGYSDKFCCLPTEFEVSADGKQTKIISYINNLPQSDEQKLGLHKVLEGIFTCFVPLFNNVLADLSRPQPKAAPTIDNSEFIPTPEYLEKWNEILDRFEHGEALDPDIIDYTKKNCTDHVQCQEGKRKCKMVCHLNSLHRQDIWTPPPISDTLKLEGRKVKVFVRLSSIHLSPGLSPEYRQRDWQTNARLNERIVATGVYYFERENITDSRLDFKMSFYHTLGGISIKENRAIAFPNILEYRTQPFRLVDKDKPGHLRMLTFYLCDPTEPYEIPTTTTIAPQQKEDRELWLIDQLRLGRLGRELPEEIFKQVADQIIQVMEPGISAETMEKYSMQASFSKTRCGL